MSDDPQQSVIDFLSASATHSGAPVSRIDTHAAAVFLAGPRVIKIKRAVRLPFLDFSTLDKRKAACEAELAVNRPYAPSIYKGVVPITREPNDKLALGGSGTPVEWAVEMARFDENATLDHVGDRGGIDDALAEALGRAVAAAHAKALPVRGFGFADALGDIVAQNDTELRGSPALFPPDAVTSLLQATQAALARIRPLLEARERDGRVARCHGDLHLRNIVLIDGAPVLFDAIEFDDRIATSDVLYDLAFLLMDLIERDLAPAAAIVLNRYLIAAGHDSDLDGLAALPLFMSARAAIRAKVTAARATHARDRTEAEQSARDYFVLASGLIAPPKPQLIAVGGLSGTGKSVLARTLAAHVPPLPGAVVLRSDIERKTMFGVAETDTLPESAYTSDVTDRVYAALGAKARRVLAAGHSAIVDAVFARAGERDDITTAAGRMPFHGLFLTANLAARLGRVGRRVADASDADPAVARQQERYDLGEVDWATIDAGGTPEDTLARALAVLDRH
jgi:aminoglycoside phosphotransferase family enzyme/predicted kinase